MSHPLLISDVPIRRTSTTGARCCCHAVQPVMAQCVRPIIVLLHCLCAVGHCHSSWVTGRKRLLLRAPVFPGGVYLLPQCSSQQVNKLSESAFVPQAELPTHQRSDDRTHTQTAHLSRLNLFHLGTLHAKITPQFPESSLQQLFPPLC